MRAASARVERAAASVSAGALDNAVVIVASSVPVLGGGRRSRSTRGRRVTTAVVVARVAVVVGASAVPVAVIGAVFGPKDGRILEHVGSLRSDGAWVPRADKGDRTQRG